MEIKKQVKVFEVDMKCDKCGSGWMRPEGNTVLLTYPEKYPHKCTNCSCVKNYLKQYPYTITEEIITRYEKD